MSFDKTNVCVYFNEHVRCYYDGRVERLQISNGGSKIRNPYWKVIKNISHKPYGYNKIGIDNKMYLRHRIIAFCYHGNFDLDDLKVEIDHRDGNLINNHSENLKVGTKRQNMLNKKGAKNYSWIEKTQRWVVSIAIDGKKYYGGLFKKGDEMLRDAKIIEMKEKYHTPVYDKSLQIASIDDYTIKEYPNVIKQMSQKIKQLENEIIQLKKERGDISNNK
jgi:hypothetical protein